MDLYVVGFILCWIPASSKVYWIVSNKPVMYGDNIILACKTDKRSACSVRQWYIGDQNKLLLYNDASVDATKYEDITNRSSTEFSLVIKSYTESDLNINYTCACDFEYCTQRLGLNDNNFIVPPLRVKTHIQQSNEKLSIYIHIERVYPVPELSIAIGERKLLDNLNFTSVKSDIFYYGTYEAIFNIVADDCGKKPTLFCSTGNEYSSVNISGEPIRNCTEVNGDGGYTPGYNSTSTEAFTADMFIYISICVVLSGLGFLGVVIIYKMRSRSNQKENVTWGFKTDDIMVMKPMIHRKVGCLHV